MEGGIEAVKLLITWDEVALCGIVALAILLIIGYNKIIERYILRHSRRYNQIKRINNHYEFDYSLPVTYSHTEICDSLNQYRALDYKLVMKKYIHLNIDMYQDLRGRMKVQENEYKKYVRDIQITYDEVEHLNKPSFVSKKRLKEKEDRLCKKIELKPPISLDFEITAKYVSPKGRNRYKDSKKFDLNEVDKWLKIIMKNETGAIELSPEQLIENREYISNSPGVYALYNKDKEKFYVGQGIRVANRASMHFSGKGNFEVNYDYVQGERFIVEIRYLKNSGFENLNDMERYYIDLYDAYRKGYNKTRGNR